MNSFGPVILRIARVLKTRLVRHERTMKPPSSGWMKMQCDPVAAPPLALAPSSSTITISPGPAIISERSGFRPWISSNADCTCFFRSRD